jgi:hypothetical protein
MQLGAAQLDFLVRLGKSPDGQQLLELITAEIAECNGKLRMLSGDGLLREQGKAVYLDEFVARLTHSQSAQIVARRTHRFSPELSS